MPYCIKKLDRRHTMLEHGFTHMIEWPNLTKLSYGTRSHKEFYALGNATSKLLGHGWSKHFNPAGKWRSTVGNSKQPPRIYFRDERQISLVLMIVEIPG